MKTQETANKIDKNILWLAFKDIINSEAFNKSKIDLQLSIFKLKTKELLNTLHDFIYNNKVIEGDMLSQNIENAYKLIHDYLTVSDLEKSLFGEVFTPFTLIKEMLDKLPFQIWSNPNLKWLDPASGIGNFPLVIFDRLMIGLKDVILDEEERRKHILENMIYMCDIQPKNVFITYQIFDHLDKYKLNLYRGSFLLEGFNKQMKEWGVDKFDIIVGNPPYNDGDKNENANKLYPKFIYNSINLLNENGFCTMITPTGWFNNTADIGKGKTGISILDEFKNKNLIYLNPNSDELKNKYFNGIASTFCYFLVQNNNKYNNTNINGITIDIRKFECLPKQSNSLVFSIFKKYLDKVNNYSKFNWVDQNHNLLNEESKEPSDILTYKSYHTPAKNITYVYSSNQHKYTNLNKVIISVSGKYVPYIDYGLLGFSNMCMAVIDDKKNIPNIYLNLNNKLFKFLIENNKFSGFNPRKFILSLPKIENLNNNNDYYKEFLLNDDEINYIESTIKD